MHGWQSESTLGPKGGWSCAFWSGCSGHLTTTAECSVAWCGVVCSCCSCSCSCSCSVVVAVAVVVVLFSVSLGVVAVTVAVVVVV